MRRVVIVATFMALWVIMALSVPVGGQEVVETRSVIEARLALNKMEVRALQAEKINLVAAYNKVKAKMAMLAVEIRVDEADLKAMDEVEKKK